MASDLKQTSGVRELKGGGGMPREREKSGDMQGCVESTNY